MSDTTAPTAAAPPITPTRLKQIANDACTSALDSAEFYEHSKTEQWNTTIINSILKALISESAPAGTPAAQPNFKFAVNSTIIQHLVPTSALHKGPGARSSTSSEGTLAEEGKTEEKTKEEGRAAAGRRGMHSATGAYWNDRTDGMWSFKFEGGEGKGLDVVISVIWIGL